MASRLSSLPDKQLLQSLLQSQLEAEAAILAGAVASAAEAATHAEAKPENKYDTRGLEASYLAGAQTERLAELRSTLSRLQQLPLTRTSHKIAVTAIVELLCDEEPVFYWILPFAGGAKLTASGICVTTITAQSPLSRALLGKEAGDLVTVTTSTGQKTYEVVAVV